MHRKCKKNDKQAKNIYCPPNKFEPLKSQKPSFALYSVSRAVHQLPADRQAKVSTECFILAMIITAIVMHIV